MKFDKHTAEQDLLIALQHGDEDAFNEIYKRYHKLVFFVANRTCHNEADAQDITQETFLTIREHVQDIRNPKYFRLWIYRIISSKCKNLFHKNQRLTHPFDDDFFNSQMIEERHEHIPHKDVHFKNDQEVLNHFIDQLNAGQRIVILMFYMEQFSIREIAEALNIPEGTVKSRLSTARSTLQHMITRYEEATKQKLNFHNLNQAIPLAFAESLRQCIAPSVLIKQSAISSFLQGSASFFSTHMISGLLIAGLAIGGAFVAKEYMGAAANKPQIINQSLTGKQSEAVLFQPIIMEGETIDTAKMGFYTLQLYACCEKDIEEMSSEQLLAMRPLYEEMKKHGGAYFEHLLAIGWVEAYEQKTK